MRVLSFAGVGLYAALGSGGDEQPALTGYEGPSYNYLESSPGGIAGRIATAGEAETRDLMAEGTACYGSGTGKRAYAVEAAL